MRIVTIVIALLSVGCAHAQQYFNTLNIIPKSGTGTASQVNLWNGANTYYLGMVAPSLAASATLTMPAPTGTPGCVQDSTGAGILVISACGLVPPVVLSGNTAGTIFTTTQNGNGTAGSFVANGTGGALTVNSQTGVAAYVTSQSGSTYTMEAINYGSGAAFYGTSGGAVFSGISTGGNVFYGTGSAFPVVYVTQTGGGVSAIDAVATSGAAVYGTASTGYGVQGQATGSGVGGWFSSSSGYALEAVGTSYLTGTVTFGASLSGTHAQNVGTGDGPSFTGMTATSAGAGTIFTTTQNGNGTAGSFVANGTGGALTVNSQTGVAAYVTSQSGSTYTMEAINYGSGAAFYGTSGGAVFSGISTGGNVFYGTGSAFPVVYVTQTGGGVSAIDAVATSGAAVYGTASTGYGVQGQATGSGVGGWFSSSSGYALEAVGTSYLTGTVTFGASLSGTHAQNVGTGDGPSFTGMTATSAGASIRDTSLAYGIVETDTGGGCNVGTAYAGGIGCSSDARLKRDVSDLAPALDGMMRLRPVDFRWIGNGRQGVGFIAQEAQEIVPQLVTSENGYLQMSYAGLVPYIVKAIQEMQKEIETAKK